MFDEIDFGTDYGTQLKDWCWEIDAADEDRFFNKLKSTGITNHSYNLYLRRKLSDNSLQRVHRWKSELPGIHEIAKKLGGGTAVLVFGAGIVDIHV